MMGEAKRRGSAEERAKQSRERREIPVADLIQELGLPPDSKYMGYVIHNPDQDDYLATIEERSDQTFRAYVRSQETALRFMDYAEACRVAEGITKKTQVGVLFDVGNQLYVAFNED
ncbi:hypothetical protein [Chromobacterium haemolyticum]|nr:hypothetical protein [Chromobacterium haemolyticum]